LSFFSWIFLQWLDHSLHQRITISAYGLDSVVVLWIRIGFNADPDPAFYLGRIHADLDLGHNFPSLKIEFLLEL
jgi:hypothetical protein